MALIASWSHSDSGRRIKQGWRRPWSAWTGWLRSVERRWWERRVKREEAYLAEAVDIADLERRMRDLERGERQRFIGYF